MQEEEIKIKKLFYVLRPLLAAQWCAERDTIAPMNILPLMDLLSSNIRKKVLSLIEMKLTATESAEVSAQQERKTFDIKEADLFFRKMILK